MRWLGLALAVGLGGVARAATCDDPFAAPDGVLALHLRLSHATWDALRLEKNPGLDCDAQYTWHEVEFRCGDDEAWLPIGVRHKRGDQRGVRARWRPSPRAATAPTTTATGWWTKAATCRRSRA